MLEVLKEYKNREYQGIQCQSLDQQKGEELVKNNICICILLGNRWGGWREKPHNLEVKIFPSYLKERHQNSCMG